MTGRNPLSPVTDWLLWPTIRCARLLEQLPDHAADRRTGDGRVVEVYPAAALAAWDLSPADWIEDPGSYKGQEPDRVKRRERLIELLIERTGGCLELGEACKRFSESDDELDALVCSLIARTAERGRLEPIPEGSGNAARAEGWIRLPGEGGDLISLCE